MTETALGFDFGMGKIGVAVGQSITGTATPLNILKAKDGIPNWQEIESLIKEWQPSRLIVGLPLNMDATTSDMSKLAEKFSRKLEGRYNLPTVLVDERLTSFEAAEFADSDEPVDAIAAQLILESYFRSV